MAIELLPTQHTSVLGLNLNLIEPKDARTRIVKACVKQWFQKGPNGLMNWGDCSGFVRSVQSELFLRPFSGDANAIFDEVSTRPDWVVLGSGSQALSMAGAAANQGSFTIGIWRNPKGRGHVAIITSYLSLLGAKEEQHAIGAWGQLGKVGSLLGRMSQSFGSDKHSAIRYARCITPIVF
jgi:hypothetical protein